MNKNNHLQIIKDPSQLLSILLQLSIKHRKCILSTHQSQNSRNSKNIWVNY